MRKGIISLSILLFFISMQLVVFSQDNNFTEENVTENNNNIVKTGYQTQYPLPENIETVQETIPVSHYETQGYDDNNKLHGSVVMVPVNTTFPAIVLTPFSSETAKPGDSIKFYIASDLYYGTSLIASAGSKVNGIVIMAKKSSVGNKTGKIQIKFTNIVTPSGQMIPISGSIQTTDGSGILKAGTSSESLKEYGKDAAVGAAAGAVLGSAMGALSNGSVGRGAIYGTALGSGIGIVHGFFEKGGNVEVPQNVQMNIVLNQPITISSNTPY